MNNTTMIKSRDKLISFLLLMLCLEVWREKRVEENGYPSHYLDVFKIM